MGLFKKKKELVLEINEDENEDELDIIDEQTEKESKREKNKKGKKKELFLKSSNRNIIKEGRREMLELLLPTIDRRDPYCIVANQSYSKTYAIEGYPTMVSIYWLNDIIGSSIDIDTNIHIYPIDKKTAKDSLTSELTKKQSQYMIDKKAGNIANLTQLEGEIQGLVSQRVAIEQGYENFFHTAIFFTVYASNRKSLEKKCTKILTDLKGSDILANPIELRQTKALESALPIGTMNFTEFLRNMNTGSTSACFPFYNSEISHKNGILFGQNRSTGSPAVVNLFDPQMFENANANIIGMSGSGKTYFLSTLISRFALGGIRPIIIDPEGEYGGVCKELGGAHIVISPSSGTILNPFDLEVEILNSGKKILDIKGKSADILNLIAIMTKGLDSEQESAISVLVVQLYEDFGFTEDPNSLYTDSAKMQDDGFFSYGESTKPMPTLSDLFYKIEDSMQNDVTSSKSLLSVYNSLKMYIRGGVFGMFDSQTSPQLRNLKDSAVIVFDVSELEMTILRPLGMYVCLTWTWEKYIKKNPLIEKAIILDEAWMLTNKALKGHEFTSYFIGTTSRRIRKRNASLILASQKFEEFSENEHAKAALTNASVSILLAQQAKDIPSLKEAFFLSDGELEFLLTAKKGEALLKSRKGSSVINIFTFDFEHEMIERSKHKNLAQEALNKQNKQ